jgi:hypothetical protein
MKERHSVTLVKYAKYPLILYLLLTIYPLLFVKAENDSFTTTPIIISVLPTLDDPINAVYAHIYYDTSKIECGNLQINKSVFPLILESTLNIKSGEIKIAVAHPKTGLYNKTTIAQLSCTALSYKDKQPSTSLAAFFSIFDARSYRADGTGKETLATHLVINQ